MRRKSRIIQGPLRRSPRKFPASASRALPILLSQNDEGNGKPDAPQETVFETYSDSGENGNDVGIGVDAVEKEANSSPLVGNNGGDSVDLDSLGLGICIKCDVEDELVLVCGEIGCLMAVHQRCMGCDPSFDGSGKFRCPVCEQKQAVARVEEARRKVTEAKRALTRFLDGGVRDNVGCDGEDRQEGTGNVHSSCRDREKTVDRYVDNGGDSVGEGIDLVKGVAKETTVKACLADTRGLEAVEEEGKGDLESDDKGVGEERETGLDSNEGVDKRVPEEDEGKKGMTLEALDQNDVSENEGLNKEVSEKNEGVEEGEEESQPEASDELGNAKEMSEAKTVVKCSKRFKQTAGKMANLQNKNTRNRSSPPVKVAATSRRKAIAKKNSSSTFYEKDNSGQKSKQSANSFKIESFPRLKRKRLHWTSEEEQMLQEGVQELTRGVNKKMSWKSILEFGRQVFDPTRTPDDLKDKWRNMMAKQT